jgi:hypothetical protein
MDETEGDRIDAKNENILTESSSSMSCSNSSTSTSSSHSSESRSSESFSHSSSSISSMSHSSSSSADPYLLGGFEAMVAFWNMDETEGNRVDSKNVNVLFESSSSCSSSSQTP